MARLLQHSFDASVTFLFHTFCMGFYLWQAGLTVRKLSGERGSLVLAGECGVRFIEIPDTIVVTAATWNRTDVAKNSPSRCYKRRGFHLYADVQVARRVRCSPRTASF